MYHCVLIRPKRKTFEKVLKLLSLISKALYKPSEIPNDDTTRQAKCFSLGCYRGHSLSPNGVRFIGKAVDTPQKWENL